MNPNAPQPDLARVPEWSRTGGAFPTGQRGAETPAPSRPPATSPTRTQARRPAPQAKPAPVDPLPANTDAEKTILGAVLLDNEAHAEAAAILKPDDFSLDSHRRIYLRMGELIAAGHACDIVTLTDELAKHKEIESIGGRAYLFGLTEGLPRRPVIGEYVRIVREKARARRLLSLAEVTTARIAAGDSPDEITAWALSHLEALGTVGGAGLRLLKGPEIVERDEPMILEGHIPDDTGVGLIGRPGDGKTTVALLIAANLSRGITPYSGAPCKPRNVLDMTNEDSPSRIRKLFAAAGGDVARLWVEHIDSLWCLSDLPRLEGVIKAHSIGCVVIDSLASHSAGVDLNSHVETTRLLIPVRALAEAHHAVILVIHHLNKGISQDHLAKVAGSIGISASLRHSLHVVPDPENSDLRLLVNGKSNLCAPGLPALRFKVFPVGWEGESSVTIDEVYQTLDAASTAQPAVEHAAQWLQALLAAGCREAKEIEQLAKTEGIKPATLRRAKGQLCVQSRRAEFGGQWFWWLPATESGAVQ